MLSVIEPSFLRWRDNASAIWWRWFLYRWWSHWRRWQRPNSVAHCAGSERWLKSTRKTPGVF